MFGYNWFRKWSSSGPPSYPDPRTWEHANFRQRARAARSFAELRKRHVPAYGGPLFIDDDEAVTLRPAQEVAQRVMVLLAVDLKAEGVEVAQATHHFDELNLHGAVSPKELEFLSDPHPDPEYCEKLVWRLESIWTLLWAIGRVPNLDWPAGMCNTRIMMPLLKENELNPSFISDAALRSTSEILDQQDLIMRIHWAARDAYINGRPLPGNLNWAQPDNWVPSNASVAVGVVEQRHHSLNWITCFGGADWDDVNTPT